MEYQIIFEISKISMGLLGFILIGTIFIIIGISIIKFQQKNIHKFFGYLFLTFSLLFTILSASSIYTNHSFLRESYITKNYKTIEGIVENFAHTHNGKVESFSVKGINFKYSNGTITSGFNHTNSFGGPIRKGLKVRISYINNIIIKLEIQKSSLKI